MKKRQLIAECRKRILVVAPSLNKLKLIELLMEDEKSGLERKVEEIEVERERERGREREREMWRVRGGRLGKGKKMRDEKEVVS
jgi:hypothetical protein